MLAFGECHSRPVPSTWLGQRAVELHEAADTRSFYPVEGLEPQGDLVWIGNWGDDERGAEFRVRLQSGASPRTEGVRLGGGIRHGSR